jgi:hypothetical protein
MNTIQAWRQGLGCEVFENDCRSKNNNRVLYFAMPELMTAPNAEIVNSQRTIKEEARLAVVEFLVQSG